MMIAKERSAEIMTVYFERRRLDELTRVLGGWAHEGSYYENELGG